MARKSKAAEKTAVEKLTEALAEFIIETINENEPAEPDEDEDEDEDEKPAKGKGKKGGKSKKDEPDFDDLKVAFTAFLKAEGKSSAKKLLKKFKIETLADLDEDDYADFQEALEEASGNEADVED